MYAYHFRLTILLLFGILNLAACDRPPSPIEIAEVGPVPPAEQRPGDPAEGYRILVNEGYVNCGIPLEAFRAMQGDTELGPSLPGREGINAELPYGFNSTVTDDGVTLVTANCLGCHAAEFNGELIIGLGNEVGDYTHDPVAAAEAVGAYVDDGPAVAHWQRWADRITAIAPYMTMHTVGVNPADNLTLALIAHRDPETLAWSPEPLLPLPPEDPPPVSVPPWWRMGKKHAMFYSTQGRGDHARLMMTIATFCTDTLEEAQELDQLGVDLRAYIASLEAPEYPWAIDHTLAVRGQGVFEQTCSMCHGTYGEDGHYPNRVVGLDEIGTDPLLARHAVEDSDPYIRWYNASFFGEIAQAIPAPGYIAPPLDGVWATAPYLHNGSVPSIAALLESDTRPRYWRRRNYDSTDYDTATLGWPVEVLEGGKDSVAPEARKHVYDTTLPGYGNGGHTFGDHLSDADRRAVLEYLKTL